MLEIANQLAQHLGYDVVEIRVNHLTMMDMSYLEEILGSPNRLPKGFGHIIPMPTGLACCAKPGVLALYGMEEALPEVRREISEYVINGRMINRVELHPDTFIVVDGIIV